MCTTAWGQDQPELRQYGCDSCFRSVSFSEDRFNKLNRCKSIGKLLFCVDIGAPMSEIALKTLLKIYGQRKVPLTKSHANF